MEISRVRVWHIDKKHIFLIPARDFLIPLFLTACGFTYLENIISRNVSAMGRKLSSSGVKHKLSWGFEDLHFGLRCLQ